MHAPQRMHFSVSIMCGTFFSPVIASLGQTFLHFPHAVHFSSSILYVMRSLQTPAGHLLSLIWALYSSVKYLIVLSTGFGAVWPSAHREASDTTQLSSSRSSISPSFPSPRVIASTSSYILRVPSRHVVHFPQLSSFRKFRKYLAVSTIQVLSSMTIMPPEPIIEPTSVSLSKSTCMSINDSGIHPPEGPPVWIALNFPSPGIPPPIS